MRYDVFRRHLEAAVLDTPGETPQSLRRAVLERARGNAAQDGVPESLRGYVDKVARHAYKVTDEDIAALQRAGSSHDRLFEVTVAAALGPALRRLDRGMAALRGEEPD